MDQLTEDLSEKDKFDVEVYKHECMISSKLSYLIRKVRTEKNMSIEELSTYLRVPKETLISIEENDLFNLDLSIRIFDYLGYELYPTFRTIEG